MVVFTGTAEGAAVGLTGGAGVLTGRLVGVEDKPWGSWQASIAKMSEIIIKARGCLRGESMRPVESLGDE
jgi:hypothetical protein